jgi:purine-binding chemotaxis protein CheW
MRDDDPTKGETPDALLQDYLDGLLGVGTLDAFSQSVSSSHYQAIDRVVGDPVEPVRTPNNVLPLPRFAETKPLSLKLPLPKLKPVAPLPKVVEGIPRTTIQVEETPQVIHAPTVESFTETATEAREEILDESLPDIESETDVEVEAEQGFQPREWLDNGRPEWAQGRFECLMFSVGGLTLAVPLIELGNISPLTDELTPLFGQIDWFMGLLPTRSGAKLRTVDTAKIVMPERYHDGLRDNYRFVISISGMDWGLAVDDVSTAISLSPEDVKWRSQRSKRPWLAGTLVSQMCAVLDIQQLAYLMFQAEQRR